jgi:hypothetical protein
MCYLKAIRANHRVAKRGIMVSLKNMFKAGVKPETRQQYTGGDKRKTLQLAMVRPDPEQEFLTSIANLPPQERERQIQKRRWYQSLAQRQGIADVEWRMEQYQQTGDERYNFS